MKKQKAELEALTSKLADIESLVTSKVLKTVLLEFCVGLLETGKFN